MEFTTLLLSLGVFSAALVALALGLIFGRGPLRSSCGGLGMRQGKEEEENCSVCGRSFSSCETRDQD